MEHTLSTNQYGDHYIEEVNGKIFSKVNALTYLSAEYSQLLSDIDKLYIIIGTDSGLLPQFLFDQGPAENSEYIFIEDPELTENIHTPFPKHPQIHLCTKENWQDLDGKIKLTAFFESHRTILVRSIGVADGIYPPYIELFQTVQKAYFNLDAEINTGTKLAPFYHIGILNIADNRHNLSAYRHKLKGKTALILGAGPSLDQHIEWIRANQERLYIFAVSRLARKLQDSSITPDFIVSVDPKIGSFHTSKEIYDFEQESTLIHSYHGNPQLIGQWLGEKCFTGPRFPWSTPLNNDLTPQTGSTVTNTALDATIIMGCKTILLAGVDFCHRSDGFTHASNSGTKAEEAAVIAATDHHQLVTNNHGENVETSFGFLQASQQFSKTILTNTTPQQSVINLSGESIQMEGVLYTTDQQITLPEEQKRPITLEQDSSLHDYYQTCTKELRSKLAELTGLQKHAANMIKLYEKLYPSKNQINHKTNNKIKKLEKKISKYDNLINTIKLMSSTRMLRVMRAMRKSDSTWSESEVVRSNTAYYDIIKNQSKGLKSTIQKSIDIIDARSLEESTYSEKSLIQMVETWKEYKQPRRALQWRNRNTQALTSLSNKTKELLHQTIHQSSEEIDEDIEKSHQINKKVLPDTYKTIEKALKDKNFQALEVLINKLKNHPEDQELPLAILLTEATIAYTDNNHQVAFELFAELLSKREQLNEILIEFILDKVANIAINMGDLQNALYALETLSTSYSDHYTPIYAKLLHATGNIEQSIIVYNNYISSHPKDVNSIMQLYHIYLETGHKADAEKLLNNNQILQKVLNHESQN